MCNCINSVEKKVLEEKKNKHPDRDYPPIKPYSGQGFKNKTTPFTEEGLSKEIIMLPMEFKYTFTKVNGEQSKERKEAIYMAMTFCPFCGEKLGEKGSEKKSDHHSKLLSEVLKSYEDDNSDLSDIGELVLNHFGIN